MAEAKNYDDVYHRFEKIWTNSHPIVASSQLTAALRTIRMQPDEVSDELLRSFDAEWVYGRSGSPFHDLTLNSRYQRLAHGQ